MKAVSNNHSHLKSLSEVIAIIEEYLKRIHLRGKYPLQTELDLAGIAYELRQIEISLREMRASKAAA